MSKKTAAEEFQEDIIGLIRKHYPRALQGDITQSDACAAQIGMALGGMLAQAYRLNGEVIGRGVYQTIMTRIVETASAIDDTAGAAIRSHVPKIQ
jgi:hypothetical protein